MTSITDIHTHRLQASHALIAVEPGQFRPEPGRCYAVGFHPWTPEAALTEDHYRLLAATARHPQVMAVGETGLDSLRGDPLSVQQRRFTRHVRLADELGMPVVAHCVRAWQQLLQVWRDTAPHTGALVVHGFRGNERVARTLLAAGCYLSYGRHFNALALQATPPDRLLAETDDAPEDIGQVLALIADTLHQPAEQVRRRVTQNAATVLRFTHPPK